jgi:hypothetical protein
MVVAKYVGLDPRPHPNSGPPPHQEFLKVCLLLSQLEKSSKHSRKKSSSVLLTKYLLVLVQVPTAIKYEICLNKIRQSIVKKRIPGLGVTQAVEHLPRKYKVLSSNLSTAKKKKKKTCIPKVL